MFGKKKKEVEKKYVIAIKDYDKTKDRLESGELKMPFESNRYMDFFQTEAIKVDAMKGLNKFIKKVGQKKSDVQHHWSGLVEEQYTLTQVTSSKGDNEFRKLFDEKYFKYLHGVV